jgi:hypothetical protein
LFILPRRGCFSTLGGMNESPLAAVLPALVTKALLVACAGQAMACRGRVLATDLAAVPLSAVVPSTDEERREAPEAGQLVAGNTRVQGARSDRQNLDAALPHAMNSLSMARRWVYGRRLELETRAFTLSVRRESSYRNRGCEHHPKLLRRAAIGRTLHLEHHECVLGSPASDDMSPIRADLSDRAHTARPHPSISGLALTR